jgi:photoactive yellow protein
MRSGYTMTRVSESEEGAMLSFEEPELHERLDAAADSDLDAVGFGIVRMAQEGRVVFYNERESIYSGLRPERVLGKNFFTDVAPCTNNSLIAERLLVAPALDAQIEYTLTFRMRPTPVRLRLLRSPASPWLYFLVLLQRS